MDKPWKVIFAFVSVFIAGAVFGGLFTLRAGAGRKLANLPMSERAQMSGQMPGPGSGPGQRPGQPGQPGQTQGQPQFQGPIGPAMMRQLNQRLKLTDEQREKIRPLVSRAAEDIQRMSRENLQNTTRVVERLHLDIAAWLTPEQRDALEDIKMQMRERVRRAAVENRGELTPRGDGPPPQRRNPQGPNRPNQSPASDQPGVTQPPPGPVPANP